MYTYKYPHPAVTVDVVVLRYNPKIDHSEVLLIKRGKDPFKDCWALPGGHAEENESLDAAAARELLEETGITPAFITQERAYGDPGRDPRGWYVTIVYLATVPVGTVATAGDDAKETKWFFVKELPENLAFDHKKILSDLIG